jgi:hypothetical protein
VGIFGSIPASCSKPISIADILGILQSQVRSELAVPRQLALVVGAHKSVLILASLQRSCPKVPTTIQGEHSQTSGIDTAHVRKAQT